jgi:hypothetical protein
MTDTERIDWLERYINERGALLLHDGRYNGGPYYGLGLRPGRLVRDLREAIDQCALLNTTQPESEGGETM